MTMKQALLGATTLALCGLSMAQSEPTTTLTMVLPGATFPPTWRGSVVDAKPTATTVVIDCVPPEDQPENAGKDCDDMNVLPYTMISGPKTFSGENVVEGMFTQHMDCNVEGTTKAVCTATETPVDQPTYTRRNPGERVSTIGPEKFASVTLQVTAGAAKLDATATKTSSGLAPKATGAAGQWAIGGMAAAALAAGI